MRREQGQDPERQRPAAVGGHDGMEPVVHASREIDRVGAGELLCGRGAMGEDLHVDPGLVHFLDAHLTEVIEAVAK